MTYGELSLDSLVALPAEALDALIARLKEAGYEVHGPQIHDGVLRYRPLHSAADLPWGWISHQAAGRYTLEHTNRRRAFDITPGPDTWKRYLFPPREPLFTWQRQNGSWEVTAPRETPPRLALLGVRPCELAALAVLDRVFLRPGWEDPLYRARRARLFIVAVNCTRPGDTCFCVAWGTGPEASEGYDLLLTELDDGFLVQIGSEAGREILADLPWEPASSFWLERARQELQAARQHMQTALPDPQAVRHALLAQLESPLWDEWGARCLGCGNCTQVCPTCFCWDVEDEITLEGDQVTRFRRWDSCYAPGHAYTAGGSARPTVRERFRQWVTHKLATWQDQFAVSGCVGCGRCITWCPAAIDLTEVAREFVAETASERR